MIFTAGIAISLFLWLLLVFKKNKSHPDKILLAWLLLITIHQLFFIFDHSNNLKTFTFLIGVDFPLPLMHGPFLYLYSSALVGNLPQRKIIWLAHFLPAALCYLYLVDFFILSPEEKLFVVANKGIGYETFLSIKYPAIIVSGVAYVISTLILLKKHRKKIKDNFSDIEKINLEWLRFLTYGIGIIWLVVILGTDRYIFIAVVIFVMVIGFFGIKQTPIFTKNHPPGELPDSNEFVQAEDAPDEKNLKIEGEIANSPWIEPVSTIERGKYQKSSLNENEILHIHGQLTDLMERKRLYTNPELTLGDIAQQLDIHPNYLSQVINSVVKKNFYDYINSQRVEEFNRAVKEPKNQKYTMLSLAYDCGFNSKTSFNRNFRKVTGQSPSEYLKQMNVGLVS